LYSKPSSATRAAVAPSLAPFNNVVVAAYAYCLNAPGYPLESPLYSSPPAVEIPLPGHCAWSSRSGR